MSLSQITLLLGWRQNPRLLPSAPMTQPRHPSVLEPKYTPPWLALNQPWHPSVGIPVSASSGKPGYNIIPPTTQPLRYAGDPSVPVVLGPQDWFTSPQDVGQVIPIVRPGPSRQGPKGAPHMQMICMIDTPGEDTDICICHADARPSFLHGARRPQTPCCWKHGEWQQGGGEVRGLGRVVGE